MQSNSRFFGLIFIVAGLVLFMLAAGELLLRITVALFGLKLVNDGLRMRGMPPVQYMARGWFFRWF